MCRGRCQRKGNVNLQFFIIRPTLPSLFSSMRQPHRIVVKHKKHACLSHNLSHDLIMGESFVLEWCHFWMFIASDQPRNRGERGRLTDCKIFLKDLLSLNHYVETFFITPGKTRQILEYSNSVVGFLKLETIPL